jgi:hypothetical protein
MNSFAWRTSISDATVLLIDIAFLNFFWQKLQSLRATAALNPKSNRQMRAEALGSEGHLNVSESLAFRDSYLRRLYTSVGIVLGR